MSSLLELVKPQISESFTVTADRSGGKSLGVNLLKGPGGKGATIKSVDAQGQLAAKVMPGLKITHINGTDITAMTMRNIGGLIKSSDQCTLTLEGTEPQAAAAAPEAAAGTGEGIYEQPVTEGQPAPVPGDAEPAAAAADEQNYEQPTAGGAQATAGEPAEALIVEDTYDVGGGHFQTAAGGAAAATNADAAFPAGEGGPVDVDAAPVVADVIYDDQAAPADKPKAMPTRSSVSKLANMFTHTAGPRAEWGKVNQHAGEVRPPRRSATSASDLAQAFDKAALEARKIMSSNENKEKGAPNSHLANNDDVVEENYADKMARHLAEVKRAQEDADAEALLEKQANDQARLKQQQEETAEKEQLATLQKEAAEQQRAAEEQRKKDEYADRLKAAAERQVMMSEDTNYPWLRGTHQGSSST